MAWKFKRRKQKKRRGTWQRNKRHNPFSLRTRLYYDLNRWTNTENDKRKWKQQCWRKKRVTGVCSTSFCGDLSSLQRQRGKESWNNYWSSEMNFRIYFFFHIRHSNSDNSKPRRRISLVHWSVYTCIYSKNLVNTTFKIIL